MAVALANGVAFGTAYTFGSFFDSMADEFGAARGSTAIIFGLTLLFFFGFGAVSGPLAERYGAHRLLAVGATLFVGGLLITSQVHHLVLGYFTYGVAVGLGSGCFTAPLTTLVGRLFVRRRALALGVTATGNGLGTLLLVPLSARLISNYGWRTAYVVLACIAAVVFAVAIPAIRMQPQGANTVLRPGFAMLRDSYFASLFVSTLLMSIGLYVAFAFIVPFAKDEGISAGRAARLVAVIGLSSIVGRLSLTSLTGRIGAIRVFQMTLVLQPIAYLLWLLAGANYTLLVLFALLLGVSYGGFVAISPEMLIGRFGIVDLGRRMGTLFLSYGLGGLLGPPAAGYVADATNGRTVPIVTVIVILCLALLTSMRLRPVPNV